MSKYKLIKDFPNCPLCTGSIVQYDIDMNKYYIVEKLPYSTKVESFKPSYIEDYPEFWEKVKEKDYEILQLVNKKGILIGPKGICDFKPYIDSNLWNIHQVKRLSDGEIFTVGDKMHGYDLGRAVELTMIKIEDDKCLIGHRNLGLINIKGCSKAKLLLLITEDGVEIFNKDQVIYGFRKAGSQFMNQQVKNLLLNNQFEKEFKWFSSNKTLTEYVVENQNLYSKKDMLDFATDVKFGISYTSSMMDYFNNWKLKNNK